MEFLAKFFVTCHLEQGISGDFSGRYQWIYLMLGLFRNKKYVLGEITQRNASKFSILVLYFKKKLRYLEKRFQTCHIFEAFLGHFIKHKHLIFLKSGSRRLVINSVTSLVIIDYRHKNIVSTEIDQKSSWKLYTK